MVTTRSGSSRLMPDRVASRRPIPELVAGLYQRIDPRPTRLLVAGAMGLLAATPTAIDDALRCAAEIHGNAVRHTEYGPTSVQVWHLPATRRALVAVGDNSLATPIRRFGNDVEDESGRGWRIVEALSDACGYVVQKDGKHVWFAVSLCRVEMAQLGITPDDSHGSDQRHRYPDSRGGRQSLS
ncbi:ATP-binding protein [Embleya sp. NPDC059237]|uniref:ATP-binding protein n=1 Tax=Embleya sp. NPDC059237 TaxID=3346784 RepID=UPI0036CC20F7